MMESKGKIYKGYSEEEVSFIRENYETMTYKQMGETIGKKPSSVRYVAISLGLINRNTKTGLKKSGNSYGITTVQCWLKTLQSI